MRSCALVGIVATSVTGVILWGLIAGFFALAVTGGVPARYGA